MNVDELKKQVAWSSLQYIYPKNIVGVGTGSTVFHFIEALSTIKNSINGVVSSSNNSTLLLKKKGIKVLNLNAFHSIDIYIDSADEINNKMQMIKGHGAALTKEKIIASMSKIFICIVDSSKYVDFLGQCPLPIEIIPVSLSYVSYEIIKMGGTPKLRENVITDNGNIIIDIYNFYIKDPVITEKMINSIPGVVTVGIFSLRRADVALIGTESGIKTLIS